jgi:hypothetical protein
VVEEFRRMLKENEFFNIKKRLKMKNKIKLSLMAVNDFVDSVLLNFSTPKLLNFIL